MLGMLSMLCMLCAAIRLSPPLLSQARQLNQALQGLQVFDGIEGSWNDEAEGEQSVGCSACLGPGGLFCVTVHLLTWGMKEEKWANFHAWPWLRRVCVAAEAEATAGDPAHGRMQLLGPQAAGPPFHKIQQLVPVGPAEGDTPPQQVSGQRRWE